MKPGVFLLLGFPGTGKYTVAKELVAELERRGQVAKLVDSHYVNNPVFGLIDQDGATTLPAGVWPIIERVRNALLDTIEDIAPRDYSFVFTNFITEAGMNDRLSAYLDRLERLAQLRGRPLHITRLTCEVEELCRRIVGPDRTARMKMTDADRLRDLVGEGAILDLPGSDALTLDVTDLAPADAARQILKHFGEA